MPKDPTKNIFQYKIRGGHLNEFEFQQNQGDVTQQHGRPWEKENFDPNAKTPGQVAEKGGIGSVKTAGKQGKAATVGAGKKQPAKATRTGAKKKTAKPTKKAASKKSPGRKGLPGVRAKKSTKKSTKK
jgi:hypothetical protein